MQIVAQPRSIVRSGGDDALSAIEHWMPLVLGRPVEPVEVSARDELDPSRLSSSELEALRLKLLREQGAERENAYALRTRGESLHEHERPHGP